MKTNFLKMASWFLFISAHSSRSAGFVVSLSLLTGCARVAPNKQPSTGSLEPKQAPQPIVKVVENGESKTRPEDCRGITVGPGINQPDPFPGYGGFVGCESPIRLRSGVWLVGFSAGYWHASAPTPLRYPAKSLEAYRKMGLPLDINAPTGGRAM